MDPPTSALARLLAERACEQLVLRYAELIDMGQSERVAELFAEDAVWESSRRRWEGRDAIREGFAARQRISHRRSRHVCTNVSIVLVDAGEATGLTYFVLYRHDGDVADRAAPLTGERIVGDYLDRFVLTGEGWRFAQRTVRTAFWQPPRNKQAPLPGGVLRQPGGEQGGWLRGAASGLRRGHRGATRPSGRGENPTHGAADDV